MCCSSKAAHVASIPAVHTAFEARLASQQPHELPHIQVGSEAGRGAVREPPQKGGVIIIIKRRSGINPIPPTVKVRD